VLNEEVVDDGGIEGLGAADNPGVVLALLTFVGAVVADVRVVVDKPALAVGAVTDVARRVCVAPAGTVTAEKCVAPPGQAITAVAVTGAGMTDSADELRS
jgi:hypothetical protein